LAAGGKRGKEEEGTIQYPEKEKEGFRKFLIRG